jgi:hypothetical protein
LLSCRQFELMAKLPTGKPAMQTGGTSKPARAASSGAAAQAATLEIVQLMPTASNPAIS